MSPASGLERPADGPQRRRRPIELQVVERAEERGAALGHLDAAVPPADHDAMRRITESPSAIVESTMTESRTSAPRPTWLLR